jgi:hypothetical protein
VIKPNAFALDLTSLTYTVSPSPLPSPSNTVIVNNQLEAVSNTVTVTITYQWIPEAFQSLLGSRVAMSSTSVAVMAN